MIAKLRVTSALIFFSLIFSLSAQNFSSVSMICHSISARQTDINKISLSWSIPENFSASSVAVFRSNRPLTSLSILSSIRPVVELPAGITDYTDTVKYFADYYYALISRDRDGKLHYMFFPSANVTVNPVKIQKPENYEQYDEEDELEEEKTNYQVGHLRALPLPYLSFSDDFVKDPNPLSKKTLKKGRELAGKYASQRQRLLAPYIFENDLVCAPGGDDYYLFQSLKT